MPIKVTAAELLSRINARSPVGHRQVPAVTLDQTTNSATTTLAAAVPAGFVFLATHIVAQATEPVLLAGQVGSPDPGVAGIVFANAAGTQQWVMGFLAFRRRQQLFEFQDSPNWRNAPPGNTIVWKPKYAIPVPEGWTINAGATIGAMGNAVAVYGHLVPSSTAATFGYPNANADSVATRTFNVVSTTSASATVITGIATKCIRILDLNIRVQPITAGTTNKVVLAQVDGRVIYQITNNNPSDLIDEKFAPEIYLKQGQGLTVTATTALAYSLNLTYEFVDPQDVPQNSWWVSVSPELPTPSLPGAGLLELSRTVSTPVTVYYPGTDTTATAPAREMQHYLRGYAASIQKDATLEPDQVLFAISAGATAGVIEFGGALLGPQTNYQLSPVFSATNHDQCVSVVVDDLNIPCPRGSAGALWIDSMSLGSGAAATPDSTDADVDEWTVTLWGRTQMAEMQDEVNRGT